jgi:hypothetical protein
VVSGGVNLAMREQRGRRSRIERMPGKVVLRSSTSEPRRGE